MDLPFGITQGALLLPPTLSEPRHDRKVVGFAQFQSGKLTTSRTQSSRGIPTGKRRLNIDSPVTVSTLAFTVESTIYILFYL
jgi:hypothetical protein